jgi:hypothetical protein
MPLPRKACRRRCPERAVRDAVCLNCAAVSFARFWRNRGNAPRVMPVAAALDWFSEGHDTVALMEARAILNSTV